MATIGKIRERSGWVIGSIFIAILGFLISDVFTSGRFDFLRGGPKGIGIVYGEEIDPRTFQDRLQMAINNQKMQMGPEQSLTADMEGQINDQVWNSLVDEYVMDREWNLLGLQVTGAEIKDLVLGVVPHPVAMQFLMGGSQQGSYDKQKIYQFMSRIEEATPEQQQSWMQFEKYLSRERIREKYNAMVKNAMYVTDLEMADNFFSANKMVSLQYVGLPLTSISDSAVEVTDAEVKDYITKHRNDYKRPESRGIEYVAFEVGVRQEDSVNARNYMMEQKTALEKSKNDSAFVARRGSASNGYVLRGQFEGIPESIQDLVWNADSGTIFGPLLENGAYKLVKVSGVKTGDTTYVYRASHILLRPSGSSKEDTLASRKEAEEIVKKIKGGADFAALAKEKSQDPGSAQKGGDVGYFTRDRMVAPFSKAVVNAKNGDVVIATTQFGVHVIKVTAPRSNRKVRIAILERKVEASTETEKMAYAQANKFRSAIQKNEDFDAKVAAMGLTKRLAGDIKPNDKTIPNLEGGREIVRWMYDKTTVKGDVSGVLTAGDKYVVARLTRQQDAGLANPEDVREQVRPLLLAERKRAQLLKKVQDIRAANNSIEAVGKALKLDVGTAENVNLNNPMLPTFPNEGYVAGYAVAMKEGALSPALPGENGIFVIKVTKSGKVPDAPKAQDMERKNMARMEGERAASEIEAALREAADIKDYRYMYY